MYLPANDQRHLFILASDRLRIAWPPIAVNQILNISTLQFHYMKRAVRPEKRDVQDVSGGKLLAP